jgi:hypothetical protein
MQVFELKSEIIRQVAKELGLEVVELTVVPSKASDYYPDNLLPVELVKINGIWQLPEEEG